MTDASGGAREMNPGEHYRFPVGYVLVKANGAQVAIGVDGHVIASTRGGVELRAAADDGAKAEARTAPEIGDEMEDGTILAGYYEGKPLYATPRDASGTYTFNEAAKYAKNLDAHGHHDFHAPSKGELNVLWENRNKGKLRGTFSETTGPYPAGYYWSSTAQYSGNAWAQRFSDGYELNSYRTNEAALRCVRG